MLIINVFYSNSSYLDTNVEFCMAASNSNVNPLKVAIALLSRQFLIQDLC